MADKLKRPAQATVGYCQEDLKAVDAQCDSTPFLPSRAEFICCATRRTLDSMRRGLLSMEALFQNYLKGPLATLPAAELARSARIAALHAEHLEAIGLSASEAEQIERLEGLETLKAMGWRATNGEQERERMSA
jgi:hypothetical protein